MEQFFWIVLLAVTPVLELRASIPLAVSAWGWSVPLAIGISVGAEIVAALVLLWMLPFLGNFLSRWWPWAHRVLDWIFAKTRRRYAHHQALGFWLLVSFVAVPFPGSGFWTGSLVSYLFQIPPMRAWKAIGCGIFLSAIIVSFLTLGVEWLWSEWK